MNKTDAARKGVTHLGTIRKAIKLEQSHMSSVRDLTEEIVGGSAYKKFPSLSTLNRSPVLNHPSSTNVSRVAFSSFQYPSAMFPPRRYISPTSSTSASVPSSRTIRASCPGMRMPVLSRMHWRPRVPWKGWMMAESVYGGVNGIRRGWIESEGGVAHAFGHAET